MLTGGLRPPATMWGVCVLLLAVGAIAARGVPASAQTGRPVRLVLAPESRLWLEGTSNVHDWRCRATVAEAQIELSADEDEAGGVIPREVTSVLVRVPVNGIRCGNGTMDQNLRRALRADQNPTIEFRASRLSTVSTGPEPGTVQGSIVGELRLAGAGGDVEVSVQGHEDGPATLRISGSAPVLMSAFGVRPPTAMLGLLRTGDRVVVRFDLLTSVVRLAALLGY